VIKPIMDRILVRRIGVVPTPDKLIEIPDQYQQKSNRCEVIAVGDFVVLGNRAYPVEDFVKPGDIVIIGEYNIEDVKVDGQDLVLVSVHDVRAKDVV
jgi:chaperonin GroES